MDLLYGLPSFSPQQDTRSKNGHLPSKFAWVSYRFKLWAGIRNNERDWDPEQVGRSMYDSFKILGLGLGATETDVKVAYRTLSRIYHPDKHDSSRTGMTNEEASEHFKLINNANQYLREVL